MIIFIKLGWHVPSRPKNFIYKKGWTYASKRLHDYQTTKPAAQLFPLTTGIGYIYTFNNQLSEYSNQVPTEIILHFCFG